MKNKISIFAIGIMALIISGCESEFLDKTPTDQVAASQAVASTTTGFAVLNGIHRDLYQRQEGTQGNAGIGGHYIHMDALGEDQVVHVEQWFNRVYKWTAGINDSDFYSRFPWVMYYKWIGNANVLINGIENASGPQAEKSAILGQALFYRAFCHYQLVQVYGKRYDPAGNNTQPGVPYKKLATEEQLGRNTVEEVYTEINKDLDLAITSLTGYGRPNKSNINVNVAKGLKARVALTMGKYQLAIQMAQEARAGFTLMNQATYANGFQDNSASISEVMWASQIQADQHDTFGSYGGYISRNGGTSAIRGNPRSIFSKLYDLISTTDVRKKLWDPTGLHTNLPTGVTISSAHQRKTYTSQKFLAVSASDTRTDVIHMRAAEMFLIEAEAAARITPAQTTLAAQALFNLISTRDSNYTLSSNTGSALINEIMIHRRVELWGEGFRFLDLKRLNLPLDRTGGNHIPGVAGGILTVPAGDNRWNWLIPREEFLSNKNPGMVQNPL